MSAVLTVAETTAARRANAPTPVDARTADHGYFALVVVVGRAETPDGFCLTFHARGDRDTAALALAFSPQVIRLQLASRKPSGGAYVHTWEHGAPYASLAALVDMHAAMCPA